MTERERIPLDQLRPDPDRLARIMYRSGLQQNLADYSSEWQDAYERPRAYYDRPNKDTEKLWVQEVFATAPQAPTIKAASGSVYPFVRSVLLHTDADWQGTFPHISRSEIAELSRHPARIDFSTMDKITQRHGITDQAYFALRSRYNKHITKLSPEYSPQFDRGVPERLLSEPPYYKQISALSCTVSCFRMIFAGIAAGKMPTPAEYAIDSYMHDRDQGADFFDETLLFRSLASPFFREKTGRRVINRVLIGATFDDITVRAQKITQTYPGSDVYAMLGVKNFDHTSADGLHAVLLLDADDQKVTFHNPDRAICKSPVESGRMGGIRETLDREEFISRWAFGLYTAQLVFALPPEQAATPQ